MRPGLAGLVGLVLLLLWLLNGALTEWDWDTDALRAVATGVGVFAVGLLALEARRAFAGPAPRRLKLGLALLGLGLALLLGLAPWEAAQGWMVLLVLAGAGLLVKARPGAGRRRSKEGAWEQARFAEGLADLLELGVPLHEAVERLGGPMRRQPGWGRPTGALPEVAVALARGSNLAAALEKSGAFPPTWSRVLAAAQRVDALPATLRSLGRRCRPSREARYGYVAFILVALLVVVFFLTSYVLPTFVQLFEGMSLQLPWSTALLVAVVRWLRTPPAFVALVSLVALPLMFPAVRAGLAGLALRLPGLRDQDRLEQQAVALRSLASSLEFGLPLDSALELAATAVTRPRLRAVLEQGSRGGAASLRSLLGDHRERFDPRVLWLVDQGERFQRLPELLDAAAACLEEEAEILRREWSAVLTVALLLTIGLGVGYVLVAVFTPLYALVGAVLTEVLLP